MREKRKGKNTPPHPNQTFIVCTHYTTKKRIINSILATPPWMEDDLMLSSPSWMEDFGNCMALYELPKKYRGCHMLC